MVGNEIELTVGGGLEYFFCFHPGKLGKMIEFDAYFSDGLEPPARKYRKI